jgi:hypothetical protein
MKIKKIIFLGACALVSASCSFLPSSHNENSSRGIREQKLSTNFVSERIRVETKCAFFGLSDDCEIVAIESTATAASYGGTTNNRKQALTRAEMRANSNIAEFIAKETATARVQTTIAKNIEKARDVIKSGNNDGQEISITDVEAKQASYRENANDTAVKLTETIRTRSQAILRGVVKIKEEVVGDQEVSVTVRWDKDTDRAVNSLRNKFQ